MAKAYIGIDIGHKTLKLVQSSGTSIKKTAVVEIPDNLVKDYRFSSAEVMAEFIKSAIKNNGLSGSNAAVSLDGERVYVKNITTPEMTEEQLNVNLPYEFRDYITDELKDYSFDYAMRDSAAVPVDEDAEGPTMNLLAVAAPKELIEEYRLMLRKAGLRLEKAAPAAYAYIGLIRSCGLSDSKEEICILDLGFESIRLHMFKGEEFIVSRSLDIGLESLERKIADAYNVDVHLAHTYLLTNYNDCQNSQECIDAYEAICTELQRAINFFQFSNPDSQLSEVLMCGGGAKIGRLKEAINNTISLKTVDMKEMIGNHDGNEDMIGIAYGITQD